MTPSSANLSFPSPRHHTCPYQRHLAWATRIVDQPPILIPVGVRDDEGCPVYDEAPGVVHGTQFTEPLAEDIDTELREVYHDEKRTHSDILDAVASDGGMTATC